MGGEGGLRSMAVVYLTCVLRVLGLRRSSVVGLGGIRVKCYTMVYFIMGGGGHVPSPANVTGDTSKYQKGLAFENMKYCIPQCNV